MNKVYALECFPCSDVLICSLECGRITLSRSVSDSAVSNQRRRPQGRAVCHLRCTFVGHSSDYSWTIREVAETRRHAHLWRHRTRSWQWLDHQLSFIRIVQDYHPIYRQKIIVLPQVRSIRLLILKRRVNIYCSWTDMNSCPILIHCILYKLMFCRHYSFVFVHLSPFKKMCKLGN